LIAYSVQGGSLEGIPIGLLIALLPAQLAMAISSSLPDEPSDRLSQKRTTVVNIGITPARTVLVTLYALTLVLLYGLQTTLRVNPIFTFVLILFITVQAALAIRKTVLPGTKAMFYFVALSILTNTVIVTGIAIKLFI
jgi:1,4-dihydroxy-2-naphthoate octaprenyltransferase